jgi:hypothetical protein
MKWIGVSYESENAASRSNNIGKHFEELSDFQ